MLLKPKERWKETLYFEICEEIVQWSNKFVVENLYKNMSWSPRKSQQVVFCQEFLIDIVHLTVLPPSCIRDSFLEWIVPNITQKRLEKQYIILPLSLIDPERHNNV